MRKFIIFSCTVASLAIILGQFGFFEALLLFFLAGVIPGTQYSIPSGSMFLIIVTCISSVIMWLIGGVIFDLINEIVTKTTPPQKVKKHLPKRRFSQI